MEQEKQHRDLEAHAAQTPPLSPTATLDPSVHTTPDVESFPEKEKQRFVDWDGPDDPKNPRNWTFRHRWAATAVVSLFTFMSPLASSMVAPALPQIAEEFGLTPGSILESMTLSVFVLGYAVGPLIFGPLSELYGRRWILQGSNVFFLVFNIACSRAQSSSQLLAFRFLAGLGMETRSDKLGFRPSPVTEDPIGPVAACVSDPWHQALKGMFGSWLKRVNRRPLRPGASGCPYLDSKPCDESARDAGSESDCCGCIKWLFTCCLFSHCSA